MGSVFLAQRVDGGVDQQAAIKIVRPDLLDASTLARFRLERQVLAVLQHPNIAGMLDLGELDDGSPYAIMEFVDGAPLDVYVREHKLDLRQRLQLFLHIGDAVAYAHTNMVVHRDLKPGNVLVDRSGRPRLLDFGIAKPLQARIGSIDVEETGAAQRFFSPAHAAPEQLRDGRIGAACDIYGLGVLLYQMLAGVPPFQLGERHFSELEHDILQVDPPAPSRRATSTAPRLRIDRDLDAIVLRCLRKQPVDRYASVGHLADDVRNYLAGRPVQARRGSALYRASRFVARHQVAVGATVAIVAIAGIGAALLWRQQLAIAEQRARAEEMTNLITDAVGTLEPNTSKKDLTAREVFERVAAQAKASPNLTAESRARVLAAIATINLDLGLPQQAETLLNQLDVGLLEGVQRNSVALAKARSLQALERYDEAKILVENNRTTLGHDSDLLPAWLLLDAEIDFSRGEVDQAVRKFKAVDATRLSDAQQEQRGSGLGVALQASKDEALRATATAELSKVLESQKRRLGTDSPAALATLQRLAYVYYRAGKMDEAEELGKSQMAAAEATFGRNSIRYANAISLAALFQRSHNVAAAVDLELQALAIFKAQLGDVNTHAAKGNFNLGMLYQELGKLDEAEHHYHLAVDTAPQVWLPSDLNVFYFRLVYARFLVDRDQITEARDMIRHALADAEAYPSLKDYDAYPLALVIDKLGDFHEKPSAANRAALAQSMRHILDNVASRSTRSNMELLIAKISTLGVEPAPAEANKAAEESESGKTSTSVGKPR
nr:serine/threonine-protein kinase [Tahibacter aquaticus]